MSFKPKRPVIPPVTGEDTSMVSAFSEKKGKELFCPNHTALKNNKAAGKDDIGGTMKEPWF